MSELASQLTFNSDYLDCSHSLVGQSIKKQQLATGFKVLIYEIEIETIELIF